MDKIIFNKKFLIGLAILAIFSLIYSFFSNRSALSTPPQITRSNPAQSSTNNDVFLPISIEFDKSVFASDLTVTSEPSEVWEITQISERVIHLTHKLAFHPSTIYIINLTWKNKPLSPLSFETKSSQGDPRLVQTLTEELNRDYPLAKKTPYDTPAYYVVYSSPMTLEVSIKNPSISQEKAISEIRDWVTSVGGDASAHKYIISDKPLPNSISTGLPENRSTKTPTPSATPFDWSTLKDDGT